MENERAVLYCFTFPRLNHKIPFDTREYLSKRGRAPTPLAAAWNPNAPFYQYSLLSTFRRILRALMFASYSASRDIFFQIYFLHTRVYSFSNILYVQLHFLIRLVGRIVKVERCEITYFIPSTLGWIKLFLKAFKHRINRTTVIVLSPCWSMFVDTSQYDERRSIWCIVRSILSSSLFLKMDNYYHRIYLIYDRLEIQWGDISWERKNVPKCVPPFIPFV